MESLSFVVVILLLHIKGFWQLGFTVAWLAQLVGYQTIVREVEDSDQQFGS